MEMSEERNRKYKELGDLKRNLPAAIFVSGGRSTSLLEHDTSRPECFIQ